MKRFFYSISLIFNQRDAMTHFAVAFLPTFFSCPVLLSLLCSSPYLGLNQDYAPCSSLPVVSRNYVERVWRDKLFSCSQIKPCFLWLSRSPGAADGASEKENVPNATQEVASRSGRWVLRVLSLFWGVVRLWAPFKSLWINQT